MTNPTVEAAERQLAAIEGAEGGALLFSSGMAAVHAVLMHKLSKGDHIVAGNCLYGLSFKFIKSLPRWGIDVTIVDTTDIAQVKAAMKENTKILYIETPANPTCAVTDIAACAQIKSQYDCILICDNTFQSPVLCKPIELGADISLYSTTKSINGMGTSVGGALTVKDAALCKEIKAFRSLTGGNTSPFDAFLVSNGLKTLPVRIRQMAENGMTVARWLETNDDVKVVHHCGLPSHPSYELQLKQTTASASCFAFETCHGFEFAKNVLRNVKVLSLAVSLGTCDSLVQHPASMTHLSVPAEDRIKAGITDTLIRISIGLEHPQDIINDLDQAFKAAKALL
ncbi:hypothetical protein GEMRC1_009145 [Eukaryota sp. GEM-RC1]